MNLSRRQLAILAAMPLSVRHALAQPAGAEAADWPAWAPARRAHYDRIESAARARGQDIRSFGARLDGVADDTESLERALQVADVIIIPGGAQRKLRLSRPVSLFRPVLLIGLGKRPTIVVAGRELDCFNARPAGDDPTVFLGPILVDNLHFERPEPLRAHGKAIKGYNVRGLSITRCSARRMGLVGLHHTRQRLRQYFRSRGTIELDPAVVAGFNPEVPDDLCEDLYVCDCEIDAESASSQLVRFDFTRRVLVAHNKGRFASISWWGGGGRREEGGDLRHLRRARDINVCDNRVSGSIGGVYGNCGENIYVARNHVSLVTDMGIDFEGCVNALARNNVVENAGNGCLATFFAARNVRFEDNIALQDGSAANLHLKYGVRKVGGVSGHTLLAMRSGGFAQMDGSVEIAFRGNRFVWGGDEGLGHCLPSFFSRLELTKNRFENVRANLAYRHTGTLMLDSNEFTFTRELPLRAPLISANAVDVAILRNRLSSRHALVEGSPAMLASLSEQSKSLMIVDNRLDAPARSAVLRVEGSELSDATVNVSGNRGAVLDIPAGMSAVSRDSDYR